MRKLLLIVGLALLLLGGAVGLAATGLRLAWDEVPPPPGPDGPSAGFLGASEGRVPLGWLSLPRPYPADAAWAGHTGQRPVARISVWAPCRSPPYRQARIRGDTRLHIS